MAAGVLLAFSVDAWWERVQEREVVDGLREAAAVEAAANRALLILYEGGGEQSMMAGRELIDVIGPETEIVPLDSILGLMGRFLTFNAPPLQFAATDRLLASGDVESLLDPDFHLGLISMRVSGTRMAETGRRFDAIHEQLVLEFGEVAPMAVLSASKPGVHSPSDFPVDVERILRSSDLEGAVGNLLVWTDNVNVRIDRLLAQSDSVWGTADAGQSPR